VNIKARVAELQAAGLILVLTSVFRHRTPEAARLCLKRTETLRTLAARKRPPWVILHTEQDAHETRNRALQRSRKNARLSNGRGSRIRTCGPLLPKKSVSVRNPAKLGLFEPTGKLLFQITGAFAEFERSMIHQRIRAGLSVIKDKLARDGKFTSKAGKVRRKLGRPGAEPDKIERARLELAKGTGIVKTAKLAGLGVGTVHRLKRENAGAAHSW
jgi:hypothetical protein